MPSRPNHVIIWIAFGRAAQILQERSQTSLEMQTPLAAYTKTILRNAGHIPGNEMNPVRASRWRKTTMFDVLSGLHGENVLSLYVDADTMFTDDPHVFFDILDAGFDLVIAPSPNQQKDHLWHLQPEDRELTYESCGHVPVQLQGGVFAFAVNEDVKRFFQAWHEEWSIYSGQDQGALLRALHRVPLKVWLVGPPLSWSGGVIRHLFGEARMTGSREYIVADE